MCFHGLFLRTNDKNLVITIMRRGEGGEIQAKKGREGGTHCDLPRKEGGGRKGGEVAFTRRKLLLLLLLQGKKGGGGRECYSFLARVTLFPTSPGLTKEATQKNIFPLHSRRDKWENESSSMMHFRLILVGDLNK